MSASNGAELFPGLWSLWPLMGLTLVLMSTSPEPGHREHMPSVGRFLSNPLFTWIGNLAYALYLWHWPILIFYLEVRGREAVGVRGAAVILAVSLVLAWLTYRFVETPLKNQSTRAGKVRQRKLNTISAAIAVVVLAAGGLVSTTSMQPARDTVPLADDWDWNTHPGATVEAAEDQLPDAEPVPSLEELPSVRPDYYSWGCMQPGTNDPGTDEIRVCEDPNVPEAPTATVVLAGGSHAGHWTEGIRPLAARYGWELLIVDRSNCPFGDQAVAGDELCGPWQDNFVEWLETNSEVDLVITPGTRMTPNDDPEYVLSGAPERWDQITATGTDLLLLRGTPRGETNTADCLAEGTEPAHCGPRAADIEAENLLEEMALPEGATTIDVVDYVCPAATTGATHCSGVVGNVVVWHDSSHLTPSFSRTMAPILERHMREAVDWLFPA
ncbi:acyltransferase family protein [Citricoccus nitrophenolicus]|uniref:acyltransferase family protein n=1 Tax=Citricoccus nitrophenolicus TaxID=863575 RepID=UPI0031EBA1FA